MLTLPGTAWYYATTEALRKPRVEVVAGVAWMSVLDRVTHDPGAMGGNGLPRSNSGTSHGGPRIRARSGSSCSGASSGTSAYRITTWAFTCSWPDELETLGHEQGKVVTLGTPSRSFRPYGPWHLALWIMIAKSCQESPTRFSSSSLTRDHAK